MFDNLACQCQKTLETERNARENADKQVLELLRDVKDRYQVKLSAYKRNGRGSPAAATKDDKSSSWGESANTPAEEAKESGGWGQQEGGWGDSAQPAATEDGWNDKTESNNDWGNSAPAAESNDNWDNPAPATESNDNWGDSAPTASGSGWGNTEAAPESNDNWDSAPAASNDGWGQSESASKNSKEKIPEPPKEPNQNGNKKKNKGKKGDETNPSTEKATPTSSDKPVTKNSDKSVPKNSDKPTPTSNNKTTQKPSDKTTPKTSDKGPQTFADKACGPDEFEKYDTQEIRSQLLTAKLDLRLMDREKSRLAVERDDLLERVEELKKRNEKLERELSNSKNMVKTLKDGCTLVENQVRTYESRHDTAIMSKADLERELIAIKEESSRHITTINNLQKSNEQISKAFVESVTAHDDLKAEFSRRLENYKIENMRLVEANNQLRKCIDFLQKKL